MDLENTPLCDALRLSGYDHAPGPGRFRLIYRLDDGAAIGRMDAYKASVWLTAIIEGV